MLKMKYKELTRFEFQQAMQKLSAAPTDGKTAYKIKLMAAATKKAREPISEEYKTDVFEKHAKRDEAGKIIGTLEESTWEPLDRAAFDLAYESFGMREKELDRPKLTTYEIRDVAFSADELEALEPILDMSGWENESAEPVANIGQSSTSAA